MAGGARLERRPRRLAILTSPAVFLVAIAAIFVLRAQDDPDYWWHLRVGEWIVDNAAVPRTELLSWLSGGGPWTAPSWGSEVVLYLLHGATGTAGSVVLFFLVSLGILAAVAALAHHVRPSLGPGWVAGLVLATAVVAMPVWGARSQLWDVLFALVALLGMLRYLDHGRVRGLIFMPLLMVAWANLHGAGTLVYLLVAAGVIAGEVWNRRAWRHDGPSWRPLLLSVAVTTLAISLNPYGPGLYVYGFTTTASGPTADYVLEWLSPNFHTLGLRPAQLLVAFGLVGVMAFVRVRDARTVALVSGFTFMFLQSGRYLEFLAPVAFGLMGPAMLIGMARILQPIVGLHLHFHDGHRRFAAIVGGVLGVILLLGRFAMVPTLEAEALARSEPVAAAAWLEAHPRAGRLFSEYGWGGYLSHELRVPVGPYGASDAFGDAVVAEIDGLFGGTVDPGEYLDRNAVDTVLVPAASVLGNYLDASPAWEHLYGDDRDAVFGRVAPVTP